MTPIPKTGKRSKKPTLAKLKKDLDGYFSQWIRRKDAINGIASCVTCPTKERWQEMQCGHYVSRVHLSTRFYPLNCHVQCVGCNVFKSGHKDAYAIYLEANFGFAALKELDFLKHQTVRFTRSEYEQWIAEYRGKLAELDERERLAA